MYYNFIIIVTNCEGRNERRKTSHKQWISFNKNQLKTNVKVSLPAQSGDTNSQAIVDANGKAVGGKYNPTTGMLEAKINADGKFTDVKKSDWFYGTAGSSKKYGIVTGYPDGTFKGNTAIVKEQIIAVSARTLQQEMGYKTPADTSKYLSKYTDSAKISEWAKGTAALGTRENLVIQRTDGKFVPQENITRGEAAVILKKLFDRVW